MGFSLTETHHGLKRHRQLPESSTTELALPSSNTADRLLAPEGVEWALAVANRNFLIHQYDEINRDLTWLMLARDMPQWKTSLEGLFELAESAIDDE